MRGALRLIDLIHWLIDPLIDWLIHWLIDLFVCLVKRTYGIFVLAGEPRGMHPSSSTSLSICLTNGFSRNFGTSTLKIFLFRWLVFLEEAALLCIQCESSGGDRRFQTGHRLDGGNCERTHRGEEGQDENALHHTHAHRRGLSAVQGHGPVDCTENERVPTLSDYT